MLSFFSRNDSENDSENDSDIWGDKIREGDATLEMIDLEQDENTVLLNLKKLTNNITIIKKINYLSHLASGACSIVYLAELIQKNGDKKTCVVKELISKRYADHFSQKDFNMDIEATAKLKTSLDKNILKLIQSFNIHLEVLGRKVTRSFAVFPYCDLFLDKYIQKNPKPPFDEIKKIMRDLIKALDYLHNNKKIIHCDINPQNIALYEDKKGNKKWCLTDFGSAMHLGENKENTGALYYRCPASFLDGHFSSHPANDIYALGQVLKLLLNISDIPKNETPFAFWSRKRSEQFRLQGELRNGEFQPKTLINELNALCDDANDFVKLKCIADAMTNPLPKLRPSTKELQLIFQKPALKDCSAVSCFFTSRNNQPASPKKSTKSFFECLFSKKKVTPVRKISVVPAPGASTQGEGVHYPS